MNTQEYVINAEKWMDNYYKFLFNYTRARVSNTLDVEEIISDTFFAALKAKDNFQQKSTERTWLVAILKHKIIDYYRREASHKGRMRKYTMSHEEYQETYHHTTAITESESSTLSDIHLETLENVLEESLAHIPQSQSNVVKLRVYEALSTEEICDRLDISKNNAWVLMSRARKSLATHLTKYDYAV
ncbi:sigma-70 family RNA polymerase sigma factor [Winogradskyella maritima]|uniref:RNA polymerase sigma factor n=1 Tax=Winogradskyella maritima TaxID=1517766 RepID=A0ABV8AF50_9FLAO|nr:sigma-70 family RNA polymerase sigma factor [Winogradskyella maritima]